MQKKIFFFNADIDFTLRNKTTLRQWIGLVIRKEGFSLKSLNYVFCSDDFLVKLNISHLNHHTLTDILTFDLSDEKKTIEGEIYISIDRVRENALLYKASFYEELKRVMIHGVLHLCGYRDKRDADKKKMRAAENRWLEIRN